MSHRNLVTAIAFGLVVLTSAVAGAQTPPPPPPAPQAPPMAPVAPIPPRPPGPSAAPATPSRNLPAGMYDSRRIDVVLSRFRGEKRIESLPFTLVSLNSGMGMMDASLRLGLDVPTSRLRTWTENGVVRSEQITTYVGMNIDSHLSGTGEDSYLLQLRLTHTTLAPIPKDPQESGPQPMVFGPATKTVSFNSNLALREGRTQSFALGVDQITGEAVRLEVTVTTVK